MNQSGEIIPSLKKHYPNINIENWFILVDNMDLPLGRLKIKKGGGSSGHNGVKSLIQYLGLSDFSRIYFGIGHPGNRELVTSYVLGKPYDKEEKGCYQDMSQKVVDVLKQLPNSHIDSIMNNVNQR